MLYKNELGSHHDVLVKVLDSGLEISMFEL